MELMKQDPPLEFKWHDVVFFIKPRANAGDQLALAMCNSTNVAEFCMVLIQRFVVDWQGVTHDGKPVPYDFKLLATLMPTTPDDNALMRLADFIWCHTDINKGLKPEVKKN